MEDQAKIPDIILDAGRYLLPAALSLWIYRLYCEYYNSKYVEAVDTKYY